MRIDKHFLNTFNKQSVINVIRTKGPIFKTEISRMTGLSVPTIMKITNEFLDKGLVREIGKVETARGKPPELLEFISNSFYIVGVDIGTTSISAIVMDLSANIVFKHTIPTCVADGHEAIINRLISCIYIAINNAQIDGNKILGIGIGMPGLLDVETGIVKFSPDFGWENVDLVSRIRSAFNLDIVMENVTRAIAMGEHWFGLGRDIDNFICVNLGYGIGAGIFVNGDLHSGHSGNSGEFGHFTLEKNGPLCDCGNYGCLESLASANAISRKARACLSNNEDSILIDFVGGNLNLIEAKTVFDAAKLGDKLAMSIINDAVEYLGIAIAGIINLFDPELIILEGGVAKAGDILLENLKEVVHHRKMKHAGGKTRIVLSELGSDAAAIGAGSFLLKRLIENGGVLNPSSNGGYRVGGDRKGYALYSGASR